MSKNMPGQMRIAPLQRVLAEPITDPSEQAALDEMRKARRRKHKGHQTATDQKSAKVVSNKRDR